MGTEDGTDRVAESRILYVEVIGHNLSIHVKKEPSGELVYTMRKPIKKMEEELSEKFFFRCAQAFIVNMREVTSVQKDSVRIGDALIPVSRSRKKEFLMALAELMG